MTTPIVDVATISCGRQTQLSRLFNSLGLDVANHAVSRLLVMLHPPAQPDAIIRAAKTEEIRSLLSIISTAKDGSWFQAVNAAARESRADYLLFMNDDMECESGAVTAAIQKHKEIFGGTAGLLTFNDGLQGGRIACAGLINRKFVGLFNGQLLDEGYRFYYGDVELAIRAQALQAYHFARDIFIWHRHEGNQQVIPGTARFDGMIRDEARFLERRRRCFGDTRLEDLLPALENDIQYYHYLGLHKHRIGDTSSANDAYTHVLTLPTDDPEWYHAAAHAHLAMLWQRTNPRRAREHAKNCVRLNPHDQRMVRLAQTA